MSESQIILVGRFIDGSGTGVRRNIFLKATDGIITDIGSAAHLDCNDEDDFDDFSHCTILPALIDCSVSLLQSPSLDQKIQLSSSGVSSAKKVEIMQKHISYCHAHGVLGVANSDDISDLLEDCQVSVELGGGVDVSSANSDFIKVAYSGNIEDVDISASRFNNDELCQLMQHKGGKKAIVVANGHKQVEEAIEAGCDAIEQGYDMGEKNLRQMAEKNVLWIPSALRAKNALDGSSASGSVCCRFSLRYVAPGKPIPGAEDFWKKTLANQIKQLQLARKLGVKTAMGTGAGSVGIIHGESMVEEMKLFIKAGYSLEETISCASENGARFFGMEQLGTLTVGRRATFLISRGTVQQLPRKLSYLEGIYVDGMPSAIYHKNPVNKA